MHIYITIRKQCKSVICLSNTLFVLVPVNASPQVIENQILKALGSKLHIAMRGNTANFRYFKNLVHNGLPYLLSSETASSRCVYIYSAMRLVCFVYRVLQTFLEELLSAKVMIPAMDYVASPVSVYLLHNYYVIDYQYCIYNCFYISLYFFRIF